LYNYHADNPPPSENGNSILENGSSVSVGAVVGIVVAVAVVIILVFSILWWKGCLRKKSSLERGNYKEITNLTIFILDHV